MLAAALALALVCAGSASASAAGRVVGYFPSWAIYNQPHPMRIANLPRGQVTVLNYAFANVTVDGSGGNTGVKGCTAVALKPGTDIAPNQLCPAIQLLDPWADVEIGQAGQPWSSCAPQVNQVCGNFADIKTFLAANPNAKAMISIGGWTLSDNFTVVASTQQSRQNFANSVSAFLKGPGSMFSGVDIDWEYPVSGNPLNCCANPQDKQNFTALLQTLKTTLTQNNPGQNLVSFAAPAGAATLQNINLGAVAQTVDWINLMTYDFNGAFPPYSGSLTNFNAPLQYDSAGPSAQSSEVDSAAVQAYLNSGVPASKINLGVPFYGRGYSGVTNANNGLFQPFTGPGVGCPASAPEAGMYPYWCLEQSYINHNGYKTFRDAAAGNVPYLFNPSSTTPESGSVMISYDDPASLQAKVAYARQQGLGGVMIWDLSMDDSNFSLLNTVTSALNGLGAVRGKGKPTKLVEATCGKVRGVSVYAHGVSCHVASGVYRTYVRSGRVRGWRCSPAGEICVQHTRRHGTHWVSWWNRQLARPAPMR